MKTYTQEQIQKKLVKIALAQQEAVILPHQRWCAQPVPIPRGGPGERFLLKRGLLSQHGITLWPLRVTLTDRGWKLLPLAVQSWLALLGVDPDQIAHLRRKRLQAAQDDAVLDKAWLKKGRM